MLWYISLCTNALCTFKGQVAWISEKQRLPVKTSGKASFYDEKLHYGRFYDRLERDFVIYVHIDVNLDGMDGFAAARHSIVKKEIDGALAWNRGHMPFKIAYTGRQEEGQSIPAKIRSSSTLYVYIYRR